VNLQRWRESVMSVYVGTWEVLFDKFKLALSNRDNLEKKV